MVLLPAVWSPGTISRPWCGPRSSWMPWPGPVDTQFHPAAFSCGSSTLGDQVRPLSVLWTAWTVRGKPLREGLAASRFQSLLENSSVIRPVTASTTGAGLPWASAS